MSLKKILPVCLVGVCLVLCFCNWRAGTWLSGWDTLHPEFNFWLYLKRIFFGVWQEHQGLGALAVQAHASDLPRMIVYWPLSLLLPDNCLRFAYILLTLCAGSLGLFYFSSYLLSDKKGIASFVGGLFYLLNLGTLQLYHFPLEMFATLFAVLPWLFLFAGKYLAEGKRKNLVFFLLFSIFSTPMAHTPTLFYAYLTMLFLFLVFQRPFKRGFFLLVLTLAVNSFWLLPNLYFIVTGGQVVQNSKISSQFSETAFLTGKQFGNVKDTLLLKNFLFDWGKYDNELSQFVGLFKPWKEHLAQPLVAGGGYLLAFGSLGGVLFAFKNKNKKVLLLIPVFLFSFLFIANSLPVFGSGFAVLQEKLPLFKEALRFPFTKFVNFLFFSQAVFLAALADGFCQIKKGRFSWLVGALGSGLIVFYMLPAFKGNFINKDMHVVFPKEYFEAMAFLSSQGSGARVGHFPLPLFWGWNYYSWNYEGAGFWWFGVPGPFLDREFDRWSAYNEQYYWEISYAVYSQNLELFEQVLNKYNVQYLLVDEQVINPSSPQATYIEEIKRLLSSSLSIKLLADFGKIKIYQYLPAKSMVALFQGLPSVGPNYSWTNYDRAYLEQGDYVDSQGVGERKGPNPEVFYPFRSLFTGRSPDELDFEIIEEQDAYIFRKEIPSELSEYKLKLAEYKDELIWIDPENFQKYRYLIPQVYKNAGVIEVVVPKVGGYFSREVNKDGRVVLVGQKTSEVDLSHLLHKFSYLICIESRNIEGRSLLFWLENLTDKRANIETYLPREGGVHYFIQPPMEGLGLGYRLHFDSSSIGGQKSKNTLGKITVNPIPFNFIAGIKLVSAEEKQTKADKLLLSNLSHPNPSVYGVEIDRVPENSTLVLSQSFHKGWRAYDLGTRNNEPGTVKFLKTFLAPLLGKEIKEHVLVNNWQNGWQLDSMVHGSKFIVLIFWPQYLQYLGFGLIGLAITSSLFCRVPGGQQVCRTSFSPVF